METNRLTEVHSDLLKDRLAVLMELETIPRHPRIAEIQRELAHIVFELGCRNE